jgi:hypothetical protein
LPTNLTAGLKSRIKIIIATQISDYFILKTFTQHVHQKKGSQRENNTTMLHLVQQKIEEISLL